MLGRRRNEPSWLLAQKELQKINQYKAPRDKLVCVLNCCRVINNLLAASASTAPPVSLLNALRCTLRVAACMRAWRCAATALTHHKTGR